MLLSKIELDLSRSVPKSPQGSAAGGSLQITDANKYFPH